MNLHLLPLLFAAVLAGCLHNSTKEEPLPDSESIHYTLPYTHAKVTATLTLVSCDPVKAKADVAVVPVAAPSPLATEQFVISGAALQSFATERDVTVTLHENRALKTVNAASTDKTSAIIGNVIKLATLVAAPAIVAAHKLECTEEIKETLKDVETLRGKIESLRAKQYDRKDADDSEAVAKQINALAVEVARLNTGPLQVKVARTIAIQPKIDAGYIEWKKHDFRKWVEVQKPDEVVPEFKLRYCILQEQDDVEICTDNKADRGKTALDCRISKKQCSNVPKYEPDTADCGKCPGTLVFRKPVKTKFVVRVHSDSFVRPKNTDLATTSMVISQWGKISTLPMNAGFGGSKTVSVTLDAFGRRTAFGWKSGASGEAVTGAFSSIGEQYVGFRDRDDGASLKEITDKVNYLEAKKKLNELEACEEVIESGGYECPGSD